MVRFPEVFHFVRSVKGHKVVVVVQGHAVFLGYDVLGTV